MGYDYVISFICVKELLEPIRSLVTCLQDNFEFKGIAEIIHIYKEIRENLLFPIGIGRRCHVHMKTRKVSFRNSQGILAKISVITILLKYKLVQFIKEGSLLTTRAHPRSCYRG